MKILHEVCSLPTAPFVDGEHLILASSSEPDVLAAAILRVITDPELRNRIAAGGRRLVEERFSMASVTTRHLALYERAVNEPRTRGI